MKISEQKLNNLILAAQAVCQSRNGANPEATRIVHERACDNLEKALKDAYHRPLSYGRAPHKPARKKSTAAA